MGEAKRRRQQDPSFGQVRRATRAEELDEKLWTKRVLYTALLGYLEEGRGFLFLNPAAEEPTYYTLETWRDELCSQARDRLENSTDVLNALASLEAKLQSALNDYEPTWEGIVLAPEKKLLSILRPKPDWRSEVFNELRQAIEETHLDKLPLPIRLNIKSAPKEFKMERQRLLSRISELELIPEPKPIGSPEN
jgi:hypothetical protein